MAVVPEFLIKRIYQKGSLKKTVNEAGVNEISVTLKNVLGPGLISGFNFVKINETVFEPQNVKFITNGTEYFGTDVSDKKPIVFRLGQAGTLVMTGKDCLVEGTNKILIEAVNPEAGIVQLKTEDVV